MFSALDIPFGGYITGDHLLFQYPPNEMRYGSVTNSEGDVVAVVDNHYRLWPVGGMVVSIVILELPTGRRYAMRSESYQS